ncbi:MAG: hypothetical protein A3D56_01115 [Candidatus Taylorbacteria bacterium RIFCSPHIGHO2_02_FULL_45_35]|uniref:AI-2E family transporter n=1 Tax=Candidatus Taylorbacteria bacterium RIFCSPHIGHO2_02_FULL_45_35 TaxID=1802311 RepID=A0A1G2MPL9_9BACT|nr:MAG: hypothetical protein A3D56_01115 [Candidatus Taylorbacteria bacterium RIFCSPHIGHO2_02_FULL_45_35]OHA33788.1 MAG: hypothetical protein A3A22_00030 [Candidatus Taylorbacteria bacterium RIFCSPLOWO2_01_FULL_45_34b]
MDKETGHFVVNITSGTIVRAILVVVFFAFLYFVRDLVLVVLTSIVIASAIEPIIKFAARHKVGRTGSVIITYAGLGSLVAAVFYFFLPVLLSDLSNFLATVPKYADSIALWNPLSVQDVTTSEKVVNGLSLGVDQSKDLVDNFSLNSLFQNSASPKAVPEGGGASLTEIINSFRDAMSNFSDGFVKILSTIFGGIFSFVLIVVLSFYFAVQENGIESFLRIVTPARQEKYVVGLWKRSQEKIGFWMQGQLLLGVLVGVLVYLGLTVLGIKNALLFAFIAAVFEIIPIFGPILAAIPPIASAFADGGVTAGLLVAGLFIIIQQFENHLIYPLVVKKLVGVPPILVILALIIGAKFAGFLGILLSVPAASIIMEYFHDVERRKITEASEPSGI